MSWWAYVQRTAPGETQAAIAKAVGITAPTVSRWASGEQGVDVRAAAQFARAYGRPVLEAFVAAGFLTPEEANERPEAAPALDAISDEDLVKLIAARLNVQVRGEATPLRSGRTLRQAQPVAEAAHTRRGRKDQ